MQYMIIFDESDKDLIDETLTDKAQRLREDCEARNNALAERLEALAIVPVPEGTPSDADQATDAVRRSREEQLIDSLQWQLDRMQAQEQLITGKILELCDHEWTPSVRAILAALYPSSMEIERRALLLANAPESAEALRRPGADPYPIRDVVN